MIEECGGGLGGWSCCLVDSSIHLANLRIQTQDRCNAPPVMATSMMAAPMVETQSTMGGGDGERMPVV